MNEPQPLPLWLIPLIPLFFVAIWLLIITMLSHLGGWSELARQYREPPGQERESLAYFPMASAGLWRPWMPLPVSYNNCLVVDVARAGVHLRTWRIFRFLHPPLFIPWTAMERLQPGRFLFFPTLTVHVRGAGTRIWLLGGGAQAVEEAWGQLAARTASPAAV